MQLPSYAEVAEVLLTQRAHLGTCGCRIQTYFNSFSHVIHYYIFISSEYFPGATSGEEKSKFIQNPNDGFGIDYVASADHSLSAYDRGGKVK